MAIKTHAFCGTNRHLPTTPLPFEGAWVQCDGCERWCHGECAGLSLEEAEEVEHRCPVCAGRPVRRAAEPKLPAAREVAGVLERLVKRLEAEDRKRIGEEREVTDVVGRLVKRLKQTSGNWRLRKRQRRRRMQRRRQRRRVVPRR